MESVQGDPTGSIIAKLKLLNSALAGSLEPSEEIAEWRQGRHGGALHVPISATGVADASLFNTPLGATFDAPIAPIVTSCAYCDGILSLDARECPGCGAPVRRVER